MTGSKQSFFRLLKVELELLVKELYKNGKLLLFWKQHGSKQVGVKQLLGFGKQQLKSQKLFLKQSSQQKLFPQLNLPQVFCLQGGSGGI